MTRRRRIAGIALPVAGAALVLAAVLLLRRNLPLQVGVVLVGLLLVRTGGWPLARPILPSDRKYVALRNEVDDFIGLVRRLNRATLELTSEPTAQHRARVLEVRDRMMESVRRMERVAGRAEGEEPRVEPEAAD